MILCLHTHEAHNQWASAHSAVHRLCASAHCSCRLRDSGNRSSHKTSLHIRPSMTWWLWRGACTRSHPELGRENPQRQWYFVSRRGRVGRRQVFQVRTQISIRSTITNTTKARSKPSAPFVLLRPGSCSPPAKDEVRSQTTMGYRRTVTELTRDGAAPSAQADKQCYRATSPDH